MRIVVTGAAGFVGGHVAEGLLADGHVVVGIDRAGAVAGTPTTGPASRHALRWASLREKATFRPVVRDMPADGLTDVLDGADAVVHFAGRPGMLESWRDYGAYLRDNVEATAALAAACREVAVPRVVHISSSSVYGRLAIGDEETPRRPVSPYGVSKLAAEATMLAYAASHQVPVSVLRLFSVYGPGQRPDMGIYRAIDAALSRSPFPLHGDGHQTRSVTYVGDVVEGVRLALERGAPGAVYNLGGSRAVSMREILAEITRLTGGTVATRAHADPPGNQEHTDADSSRAALELGYVAKVGLADGLSRQIGWQSAHPRSAGTA